LQIGCRTATSRWHSGKPAPDGFLLAAERLAQPIEACLVFEDSGAGIQAAEAPGAAVVVINATHRHPMETPHPSIAGFETLQVKLAPEGGLDIVIAPATNA
jgi:mannitol-1-/sugar-/sorbitol-6-phosphatase